VQLQRLRGRPAGGRVIAAVGVRPRACVSIASRAAGGRCSRSRRARGRR
jgi:hypothetical protein